MSLWSETLQHSAGQNIFVSFRTPSDVLDSFTLNVSEPSFQVVFSFDGNAFNAQHESPDYLVSLSTSRSSETEVEYSVVFTTYVDAATTITIDGTQFSNAYATIKE